MDAKTADDVRCRDCCNLDVLFLHFEIEMSDKNRLLLHFGENLRSCRIKVGISQEELAHKAGLDRSYVGGVERGERNVSLLNVAKLARSLGLTASDLLRGIEDD